jgi:hypothetical protein
MALQNTNADLIPLNGLVFTAFGGYLQQVMTLDTHSVSFVFRVPKTGSITTLRIRTMAAATPLDLRVGLYTVDPATGLPTSTQYGGSAFGTIATPAANTLGTAASATVGDLVAVTIAPNASGTFSLQIASTSAFLVRGPSYVVTNGAKVTAASPIMSIGYSDNTYPAIEGTYPFLAAFSTAGITTGTAVDEHALRFSLPFKARIKGIIAFLGLTAGSSFEYAMYNDTTLVSGTQKTYDTDMAGSVAGGHFILLFDTPVELDANQVRYLSIKPLDGSTLTMYRGEVSSAAQMEGVPGAGAWYRRTRADAGAWSSSAADELIYPAINPIFDRLDDGAGLVTGAGSISGDLDVFGVGNATGGTMYAIQVATGALTSTAVNAGDGTFSFTNLATGTYHVFGIVNHAGVDKTTQVRIETVS